MKSRILVWFCSRKIKHTSYLCIDPLMKKKIYKEEKDPIQLFIKENSTFTPMLLSFGTYDLKLHIYPHVYYSIAHTSLSSNTIQFNLDRMSSMDHRHIKSLMSLYPNDNHEVLTWHPHVVMIHANKCNFWLGPQQSTGSKWMTNQVDDSYQYIINCHYVDDK